MKSDKEKFELMPMDVIPGDIDALDAQKVLDAIELHMRRYGFAVAVVETRLEFVKDELWSK